jgi:hypothetical protein
MRIQLEIDDFRFFTASIGDGRRHRWLCVELGGKKFWVQRELDIFPWDRKDWAAEIDKLLLDKMAYMIEKAISKSISMLPDGDIDSICKEPEDDNPTFHGGSDLQQPFYFKDRSESDKS